MSEHRNLTGTSLHEPKGVATAVAGKVYVADGAGSGEWTRNFNPLLTDTVWDDIVVPIVSASAPGISAPGLIKVNDDGAGSTGVYYYGFDATAEEEVFFTVQLPHRYKAGTDLKPHIHWGTATGNAGNIVWGLEYCASNNGEVAGNTTIITATAAAPASAKEQTITSLGTIDGSNLRESSILNCRFFRKAGDAADTLTGDACAMSFDVHFEIEKMGTDEEYPS